MSMRTASKAVLFAVLLLLCGGLSAPSRAVAQDTWQVKTLSGAVEITNTAPVSRDDEATLSSGDTIRTGADARVLLLRGAESMLLSPNTVVGIPRKSGEAMPTTFDLQIGSVQYECAPGGLSPFVVETPYLAAAATGANFLVVVDAGFARVEAIRGNVEISDFQSGQNVPIAAGQRAEIAIDGGGGLSLSGTGPLAAIRQGAPRPSPVKSLAVLVQSPSTPAQAAGAPKLSGAGSNNETAPTGGSSNLRGTTTAITRLIASPAERLAPHVMPPAERTADVATQAAASPTPQAMDTAGQGAVHLAPVVSPGDAAAKLSDALRGPIAAQSADVATIDALRPDKDATPPDARKTKEEIAKFLAAPAQTVVDEPPRGTTEDDAREVRSFVGQFLSSWGLPLVIGAIVAFLVPALRQNRPRDQRRLDYDY